MRTQRDTDTVVAHDEEMTWNHSLTHKLEAFVSFLSCLQHTQAIMRVPPPSLPPPDAVEIHSGKEETDQQSFPAAQGEPLV